MKREVLFGTVGILVGLVVGFLAANSLNRQTMNSNSAVVAETAPPASTGTQSGSGTTPAQPDVAETIRKADAEPQNFVAQMKAGDMFAKISRFDKAAEYYKKGIAVNPGNLEANIVLANALFDSKQFTEAGTFYEKAIAIDPLDKNVLTDLGATFVERPEPDLGRAISEFRKALRIDPKHPPALYYLGIARFRNGELSEAKKILEELRTADPTSELVTRLKKNLGDN